MWIKKNPNLIMNRSTSKAYITEKPSDGGKKLSKFDDDWKYERAKGIEYEKGACKGWSMNF